MITCPACEDKISFGVEDILTMKIHDGDGISIDSVDDGPIVILKIVD